jgi:hypothetical protein
MEPCPPEGVNGIYDVGGQYLGELWLLGLPEDEANARVMIAGPELLDALIQLNSVTEKLDGISTPYWRNTQQKVNAAIRKASGRCR